MTEFQHSGVQDSDRFRSLRQKVDSSDYAVEEIVKELGVEEGMTILDFGCGEGSLLLKYYAPLAEAKNARVVGIDISKSQIELAKKYNTHPRVEYLCGNILSNADNPLVGRKFDRIVSVWVLDYFMDYAHVIKELSQYLKPNGLIWFLTSAEENYFNYYEQIRIHPVLSKHMGVPAQPDWVIKGEDAETAYRRAAKGASLEIVNIKTRPLVYTYANMDDCTEMFTSMLSSVNKLTPELTATLKAVCASEVANKWVSTPVTDYTKPLSFNYKMLTMLARKVKN